MVEVGFTVARLLWRYGLKRTLKSTWIDQAACISAVGLELVNLVHDAWSHDYRLSRVFWPLLSLQWVVEEEKAHNASSEFD